MAREITWEQGKVDIEWVMKKYPTKMRDKTVGAIVDNILWAVAEGHSPKMANSIITQYELHRPVFGSHEFFIDGVEKNEVIHLDPNFVVPDEWRVYKGDKKHPGGIKPDVVVTEQDGWNGRAITALNDYPKRGK